MPSILVVEDNKKLHEQNKNMLEKAGYNVLSAFNGEEAIRLMETESLDLVLLDLLTPKVNGFGVLAYAKEHAYAVPIVVLTNLGQKIDRQECKELGATDFIVKSGIDLPVLLEKVREHLEK